MIFKTPLELFEYVNTLLLQNIKISIKDMEKMCSLNGVKIHESTFIDGPTKRPELHSLQILEEGTFVLVYTQDAWMNKLPSLYHENKFLENFLFGFEQEYLKTEQKLDEMDELFNPSKTDFVDWLASWVGIAFSQEVDERAKRRVLHNIVQLYKIRGTKEYFIKLIKYLCDISIRIDDSYKPVVLHHTLVSQNSRQKSFTIYIDDEEERTSSKKISLMKAILQKEKPIGVEFKLFNEEESQGDIQAISQSIDLHSEDSYGYDYDDYESGD